MGKAFLSLAGSMSNQAIGLLIVLAIAIIVITGYFLLRRRNKVILPLVLWSPL